MVLPQEGWENIDMKALRMVPMEKNIFEKSNQASIERYMCAGERGGASLSVPHFSQELWIERNNVGSDVTLHEYLCVLIQCLTMAVGAILAF